MKTKVKNLKNLIREFQGTGLSTSRTPYSYRNEFSNRFEISIPLIIKDKLEIFTGELLRSVVENTPEGFERINEDPTFEAQMTLAIKDLVIKLDVVMTDKISQLARESVEKLKNGEYEEADRVSINDMY